MFINQRLKTKISLKLILAVLVWVCAIYLYYFHSVAFYVTYRCLKAAPSWHSCYSETEFDFTTDLYGMRYEGNSKNFIDRYVLSFGAYEKPVLYFLRDVMKKVYSNEGVFLDIGANVGEYSLFMSRYVTKVHAFEPYEPVLIRFRRMIELNSIQNITIHPVGLGNKNEKLQFYEPPKTNLAQGSFHKDIDLNNTSYKELQVIVGDSINFVPPVSLIKIDIEGYEKYALEGLAHTLKTNRPIVVFEIHVNPGRSFSFRHRADMESVFPKGYGFLVFDGSENAYTGSYKVVEMDQRPNLFTTPGRHLAVAYPAEKEQLVPRKYQSLPFLPG